MNGRGQFPESWEDGQLFDAMTGAAARRAERERAAEEREAVREDIPFLETSVATTVLGTIDRCIQTGQNALIEGVPGVGKTRALEEAVRRADDLEGPNVAVVTIMAAIGASTLAVFEEVCPYLGVKPAQSIAATLRRMTREALFSPIIVFDEAQNLTLKTARDLLEISKAQRIPMIFCGNDEVLKLVNSKQAAIQQIPRRLPIRERLVGITDDDADLIASHFGVEEMDTFRLCRAIGRLFHADGIVTVLREAREQAGRRRGIRLPHVCEAVEIFPHFKVALAEAERAREARERVRGVKRLSNRANPRDAA